jgi:hypothetical protein
MSANYDDPTVPEPVVQAVHEWYTDDTGTSNDEALASVYSENNVYSDKVFCLRLAADRQVEHFNTLARELWNHIIVPYIKSGKGLLNDLDPDRDFIRFYGWLCTHSPMMYACNRQITVLDAELEVISKQNKCDLVLHKKKQVTDTTNV